MEYDLALVRRNETHHFMPDSLSRRPCSDTPQQRIDDSFRDNPSSSSLLAYAGPRGPILDGVLVDHLTPAGVEGQHP